MNSRRFIRALVLAAAAIAGCAPQRQPPPPAQTASTGIAQTAAPIAAQSVPLAASDKARVESQFLDLVNYQRRKNGLKPLSISRDLDRSAQAHSSEMAKGRFVSVKGDNEPRLVNRFEQAGVRTDSVGENVLSLPVDDGGLADYGVRTWMAQDAARRNLLSPRFERTGFGIERAADSIGAAYITEDFAH